MTDDKKDPSLALVANAGACDVSAYTARQLADQYLTDRGHECTNEFYAQNHIKAVTPQEITAAIGHPGKNSCGILFSTPDGSYSFGRYTSPEYLATGGDKCFGPKGRPNPGTLSGTPDGTLVIAEGKSKEMTFARLGYYAISAGGVNGVYNSNGLCANLPEMLSIHSVIIAFDDNIGSNPNVWWALKLLVKKLQEKWPHLSIYYLQMTTTEGLGIDDFVVRVGGDDLTLNMLADCIHPWRLTTEQADLFSTILSHVSRALLEDGDTIVGDPRNFATAMQSTLWNSNRSKLSVMHEDGTLRLASEKDAYKFISKACGVPFEIEAESPKAARTYASTQVLDHIKYHNQRNAIRMYVDMFAKEPRIVMGDEVAEVYYIHEPWEGKPYDQSIVDDYIAHFPEFVAVIRFIVASRFARDRKMAYLWLHCLSDWGKGFLMALFEELGATAKLAVVEVEKIFEGGPVGKSMTDFKRSLCLFIDEMKSVKSEIKQLQNTISLSPKNQLQQEVDIFAKIFMSAEAIPSLAGEDGVEDQFANRMSLIRGSTSLRDRAMFEKVGNAAYFDAVLNFLIEQLNSIIAEHVAMGKEAAELHAQRTIEAFYEQYKIEHHYERLSSSTVKIAKDFRQWLGIDDAVADDKLPKGAQREMDRINLHPNVRRHHESGDFKLSRAAKTLKQFLDEAKDFPDKCTLGRKANEILDHLGPEVEGKFPAYQGDRSAGRGRFIQKVT